MYENLLLNRQCKDGCCKGPPTTNRMGKKLAAAVNNHEMDVRNRVYSRHWPWWVFRGRRGRRVGKKKEINHEIVRIKIQLWGENQAGKTYKPDSSPLLMPATAAKQKINGAFQPKPFSWPILLREPTLIAINTPVNRNQQPRTPRLKLTSWNRA